MDDLIFEEFKGTGNMEAHMNRKLADRRIYPAIDWERSSTRREELLIAEDLLPRVWTLRRMLSQMGGGPEEIELVVERMAKTRNNREFLEKLNRDDF
jgi:transcription termination factor Rho